MKDIFALADRNIAKERAAKRYKERMQTFQEQRRAREAEIKRADRERAARERADKARRDANYRGARQRRQWQGYPDYGQSYWPLKL